MGEKLHLVAYTDGGSKGNPGPAGFGYVIELSKYEKDDARVVLEEHGEYIGRATNNVAEYRGFIAVLKRLKDFHATKVTVYSDSELAVKQINGQYRVKNEGLKPLHEYVMLLLAGFSSYTVKHIPREYNTEADRLANQAIKKRVAVGNSVLSDKDEG